MSTIKSIRRMRNKYLQATKMSAISIIKAVRRQRSQFLQAV